MIPRARGGSSRQVEATNREHAVLTAKALDESKAIAARVQRRTRDERQLFRSRKYEERTGSHRCRLHEGVRRVNRRTLQIPRHRLSADQGGHPQGHRHPLLRDPGENAAGAAQDEAGRRRADVPDQHRRQAAEVAAQEPGQTRQDLRGIDHGVARAMTAVGRRSTSPRRRHRAEVRIPVKLNAESGDREHGFRRT